MRGLIIKDLKLLKSQRMFLIVVAAGSILFLINGSDPGFVFSYVSAMFSLLVITTISFDEFHHDTASQPEKICTGKVCVWRTAAAGDIRMRYSGIYGYNGSKTDRF